MTYPRVFDVPANTDDRLVAWKDVRVGDVYHQRAFLVNTDGSLGPMVEWPRPLAEEAKK